MSNSIELIANRCVDSRVIVAVHVAPHTTSAIDILAAIDVDQPATLGTLDNERFVFRHLREGMPMVAAIPFTQFVASWRVVHVRVPVTTSREPGLQPSRPASLRRF